MVLTRLSSAGVLLFVWRLTLWAETPSPAKISHFYGSYMVLQQKTINTWKTLIPCWWRQTEAVREKLDAKAPFDSWKPEKREDLLPRVHHLFSFLWDFDGGWGMIEIVVQKTVCISILHGSRNPSGFMKPGGVSVSSCSKQRSPPKL